MLRKLTLMLLSSLFISLSMLWVTTYEARKLVLASDFYKQEIHDYALVGSLYDELLSQLETQQTSLSQGMTALEFSPQELSTIMKKALPPQWIEDQIGSSLDQAFSWMKTDEALFDLKFDISQQKKTFRAEIQSGITAKEQAIPICTSSQLLAMQTTGTLLFNCRPAGVTFDQFLGPEGLTFFDNLSTTLPDMLSLRALMEGTVFMNTPASVKADRQNYQNLLTDLQSIRQVLKYGDTGFIIGSIALLGLLALVIALSYRKPRSLLRWVGYAVFMSGLFLKILSIGLERLSVTVQSEIIANLDSSLSVQLRNAIAGVPHDLVYQLSVRSNHWANGGLEFGTSCFVILLVLWIVRLVNRRKKVQSVSDIPLGQ